jgi:hypothetical protein
MRDWLVTVGLAAAALLAFYSWIVKPGGPEEEPVSRPISTEGGPNGYLGMVRWLRGQQIEPLILRDRFTMLSRLEGSPARGNLLISTAPHRYPLRNSEFAPLRRWIEAGNTLLLVAGLSDTPEWGIREVSDTEPHVNLGRMTGLKFQVVGRSSDSKEQASQAEADADEEAGDQDAPSAAPAEDADGDADQNEIETDSDAAADEQSTEPEAEQPEDTASNATTLRDIFLNQRLGQPMELDLVPVEAHELLTDVERVHAISEYPASSWIAVSDKTPLVLELATSPQADAPVLWLARAGRGQMIISGFGSIFTNKLLARDDNAQLLANIVQWSLADGGRVIIDDAHQGAVAFYDPQAFFGDPRLQRTLWCLFGLWLVFVLGAQRMRVTVPAWSPADLTAFIRSTGGFMARVIERPAAARRMFELFFTEVHQRTGLPVEQAPPWDWLAAHTGIAAADLEQLRKLHAAAYADRRVNLQALHTLLAQVRGSWLRH